jgi:hypothetical protein
LDLLHRHVSPRVGLCPRPQGLYRRGVRCPCMAFPPCTARCSHGLWIDHVPMPATSFPTPDSSRCPFHPAVPCRSRCPDAREARGKAKCSRLRLAPSGPMHASRPEGRPPAGTGSLAARRLLRFRSARSQAPRREWIGIGRKASARPEGLASAASRRPRRAGVAPADDPERYPPYRSVSPEGARSPVSAVRSEERPAAPAHSPGGLAPVVRAHPRTRVARRRRAHGRMARRRLPTPGPEGPGVVVGAPLARALRRVSRRTHSADPRRNPTEEASRSRSGDRQRLMAPLLSSKLGERPRARQTSLPSKTASSIPKDLAPETRRPRAGAEAPGARWSPRSPLAKSGLRRGGRSPRAEPVQSEDRADSGAPRRSVERSRSDVAEAPPKPQVGVTRPGDGVERVDVTSKNVSEDPISSR